MFPRVAAGPHSIGKGEQNVEIREIPPSLEDVFVTLTRDAERSAASNRDSTEGSSTQSTTTKSDQPAQEPPAKAQQAVEPNDIPGPEHPQRRPRRRKVGRTTDGLLAIMVKEFAHIRAQPSTLFFMLVVPVMQTIIFGWAIDTQIEHIPLVVFDQDGRADGRRLVEAFVNTERFDVDVARI